MQPTSTIARVTALAATMFLFISGSQAQITIDDAVTFTTSPTNEIVRPSPYNFAVANLGNFDPGASDKLILAFSSENAGNVVGVTYRGVTMQPALFAGGSNRCTGIFYLDSPPGPGGLVITFSSINSNGVGGALVAVSGTEPGFGAVNSSSSASVNLATTAANSLVVTSTAINSGVNPAAQPPLTTLFSSPVGSATGAAAYQLPGSPGTVTSSFSSGEITIAVEFLSATPSDFRLIISPNANTPGHYGFTWNSRLGKLYDLVSHTDLSSPPADWPVWQEQAGINASATGVNSLANIPGGNDPRRFFAVVEKDPPVVEVAKVRVFLVGGQSNADGRAATSGLPTAPLNLQLPQADIDFYRKVENLPATLTTLRPGLSETGGFGPEITFGRAMADELADGLVTRLAIIKYANGGTNLQTQWKGGGNATTTGDGPEYLTFQQTVTTGLAALASAYPTSTIEIEGMIWLQGESDISGGASMWTNYQTNLTTFLADIRATYGASLPFIVIRLSNGQTALNATGLASVRAAQQTVAEAAGFAAWVNTDGFGMLGDNLHFNPVGQQAIGNAAAMSLLNFFP